MNRYGESAGAVREAFQVGEWTVWPAAGQLRKGDHVLHVEPKVMGVLECLARANGDVVSRDELLRTVWDGVVVNEEVLTRAVSELRTLLGDVSRQRSYIATVPRKGYRLLMPVSEPEATSAAHGVADSWLRSIGCWLHRSVTMTGYGLLLLVLLSIATRQLDSDPPAGASPEERGLTLIHVELVRSGQLTGWLRRAFAVE